MRSAYNIFKGLFDTEFTTVIDVKDFLLCVGTAIVIGLIIGFCYTYNTRYTHSFFVTLVLLPAVVSVVIMMVNGNIGAGIAVAGAFSLVRFRSVPGSAKEILTVFLAMCAGLIVGMGYLAYALLFTVLLAIVLMLLGCVDFGHKKRLSKYASIRITVPEDLDYSGVFEDIFSEYTTSYELTNIKTTNMGSMFRLTYDVTLKKDVSEKEMIDKIRTRNGNLEIAVSKHDNTYANL